MSDIVRTVLDVLNFQTPFWLNAIFAAIAAYVGGKQANKRK